MRTEGKKRRVKGMNLKRERERKGTPRERERKKDEALFFFLGGSFEAPGTLSVPRLFLDFLS